MNESDLQRLAEASPNFGFLGGVGPQLLGPAVSAERIVFLDPPAALTHLRRLGENLAMEAAAVSGIYAGPGEDFFSTLQRLENASVLTREVAALFHDLRKRGNDAAHDGIGTSRDALHQLRMGHKLAGWFIRSFVKGGFKLPRFVPPPNPAAEDEALRAQLDLLRSELAGAKAEAEKAAEAAQAATAGRDLAEREARQAYAELDEALELAAETEAEAAASRAAWERHLGEVQEAASAATKDSQESIVEQARLAGTPEELDLDEAATRQLIDQQLRDAGWEVDSTAMRFAAGVRPIGGRNLGIAEWPTRNGPADYVLFRGLQPIAVVEAKRKNLNVPGAIEQAKRYSRGFEVEDGQVSPGGPWENYAIPFLFATNGRPYLSQLRDKSGVWFLDGRRSTNHPRALDGWYTPDGLRDLLAQDHGAAEQALAMEPTDYLGLRDYQLEAIRAVEAAIKEGQEQALLAMATGTGKTRTALGLIYRLLKARRFRRILFLVDRKALAEQAEGAFKNVKLESLQSLDQIYDVRGLGDGPLEDDTRLHIATVQSLVRSVVAFSEDDQPVPVDRYDCIVVDESHRGYNLDREMSEGELQYRSEAEYVSKYRRVLDHFDAVRIGLTATPALHTTEIFGKPVHQYSYRQAVVDGYLVDHEPPYRISTMLAEKGIHWQVGEEVAVYRTRTGQVEMFDAPDEIDVEIDGFNTRVVTEEFNQAVCEGLAAHIDPSLPGKTLVFCATDAHADMVVRLLKEAFSEQYGEVDDGAVLKITGRADKPLEQIRRFKNERHPAVAVTVDLLTTGIDVPEIVNLVFLRRVKSRILYEQMLGRATRLCPDIGKEAFRIFDAVDLYAALEDYSTMKPVVTSPALSFEALLTELIEVEDDDHVAAIADEVLVKFHRKKGRLVGESGEKFAALGGGTPEAFVELLKRGDASELRGFFRAHDGLAPFLDQLAGGGGGGAQLVSTHADRLTSVERGYGDAGRPEDYLEGFGRFIEEHRNELPALQVVLQRPRDLKRAELRQLRLELDRGGYSETQIRAAYADATNQDIAAGIIGFLRAKAIGSPLIPFEERVARAVKGTLKSRSWTNPQRNWLKRIGEQLLKEVIVDRAALDRGEFRQHGGYQRLNKVFEGQLDAVLEEIHDEIWKETA